MGLKINLGCGNDVKNGYVNVDFHDLKAKQNGNFLIHDLSAFPWPFSDNSASEILMLDFLEHFRYFYTSEILHETWRILEPDGFVDIQVPDFEECATAMLWDSDGVSRDYRCNACGFVFTTWAYTSDSCSNCGQTREQIAEAAMKRLYGGQDRPGNWHYAAFTKYSLQAKLEKVGFYNFSFLEQEHQLANWNFKIRAHKKADLW